MTWYNGILLTVALLIGNAYFVAAEFALISARRARVEPLVEQGNWFARITLFAMERISLMMASAQLGITVCSLALGSISEPVIATLLNGPLHGLGIPANASHAVAFVIALALITYLHVVIGEMVPKNLALAAPERLSYVLAPLMLLTTILWYPVIWLLNTIANLILRLFRVTPKDEVTSAFTRDEVAQLVEESRSGGLIEANDERLLLGALQFESQDVSTVLLPMDTVRMLPVDITPERAEELSAAGFSRFPITDGGPVPIGYVHIKDLLVEQPADRSRPMDRALIRELPTVRPDDSLRGALVKMQKARAHLALVRAADEAPLGIVAMEDVLEELVGEVRDDSRRTRPRR